MEIKQFFSFQFFNEIGRNQTAATVQHLAVKKSVFVDISQLEPASEFTTPLRARDLSSRAELIGVPAGVSYCTPNREHSSPPQNNKPGRSAEHWPMNPCHLASAMDDSQRQCVSKLRGTSTHAQKPEGGLCVLFFRRLSCF